MFKNGFSFGKGESELRSLQTEEKSSPLQDSCDF
jgi:hypothetical protein